MQLNIYLPFLSTNILLLLIIFKQRNQMSLLTSKRLVISSMLLREPYRRFQRRLHPSYAQKLVKATQTLLPLQYKLHPISIPISLEKPHQPPMKPLEALPFSIDRTVSGNLPVYIKYNCNHKIKKTIIRRINGDVDKMID